jgi:hypothetical protein
MTLEASPARAARQAKRAKRGRQLATQSQRQVAPLVLQPTRAESARHVWSGNAQTLPTQRVKRVRWAAIQARREARSASCALPVDTAKLKARQHAAHAQRAHSLALMAPASAPPVRRQRSPPSPARPTARPAQRARSQTRQEPSASNHPLSDGHRRFTFSPNSYREMDRGIDRTFSSN